MDSIRFFSLKEMTATSVKAKNSPDTWIKFENLYRLTEYLDRVRSLYGAPIRVNSGFRSEFVNLAVKGSQTSAHLNGLAADIVAWNGLELDNRKICSIIESLGCYDQLIVYHERMGIPSSRIRFMHVGLSNDKPRLQLLHK